MVFAWLIKGICVRRGLKSVDKENHILIVDLLCSLAQGLTSKWIMNKAQSTTIMAVQYAA